MDYESLEDRQLAQMAAEGREGAYRELLSRYERPVYSLILRMVSDPTLAEDLAQEAFVKAFNAIGKYDPQYKFSSWIFKIANNRAIDHLRKRELETVSIDGSPDATTAEEAEESSIVLESREESPEKFTESRELGGQIEEAIGKLKPEYRSVILLRHVEGHAYDEIADILELPLGTVKTYIHRARAQLKAELASLAL